MSQDSYAAVITKEREREREKERESISKFLHHRFVQRRDLYWCTTYCRFDFPLLPLSFAWIGCWGLGCWICQTTGEGGKNIVIAFLWIQLNSAITFLSLFPFYKRDIVFVIPQGCPRTHTHSFHGFLYI